MKSFVRIALIAATLALCASDAFTAGSSPPPGVQSFNGRRGVVAPQTADYSFPQISGNISPSQMNSGSGATSSTFWRGDGTWAVAPGGVSSVFGRAGVVAAQSGDYSFPLLSGNISPSQMNSGSGASSSTFWRGDGTWASPPGGVSSVFGRTGAVGAQSGDYSFSQIAGTALAGQIPADVAYFDLNQTFTKSQRDTVQSLSLSSSTATPNFDNGNHFTLTLSSACPCTLANPSTTPVAGQGGVIEIIQDGTGSRTIGTWGSNYTAPGGTSTITLSTGANARDYVSYYVADSTHIVLTMAAANATH